MHVLLPCLIVLSSLSLDCRAARILALFPTPSRSHVIAYEALTKELANRGHQVTVVSMFPQEKPPGNYTDIAIPLLKVGADEINYFEFKNHSAFFMINIFLTYGSKMCESALADPAVQTLINGKDDSFDLLIIPLVFNECMLGFAHKFNIPFVGIVPMGGIHFMFEIIGNPSPYAYTPDPMMGFTDHMTFAQRLVSTLFILAFKLVRTLVLLPQQDAVMRKYFNASEPIPHVSELESRISLLFLNNHVSLNYPRPYMPNVIEVGGMHIRPAAKLPQDLQQFLNAAKDGVIYFSMGSNLKSANLPEEKRRAFLEAFSKMKQQVLWKWEEEELPGRPGNVRLGKWLPQAAILGHPNVKLFITHGGLLSMQEAVYHGVPTVSIPIFGDQELNVKRAQHLGIGVKLEFENITGESVLWAVNAILGDIRYSERVKELSSRFRDQPTTPLERAVFWTEYVIRHKGAPHLRSPALTLSWYQYFLLDVLAVTTLVPLLSLLLLYKVTRKLMCGSGSKHTDKLKTN